MQYVKRGYIEIVHSAKHIILILNINVPAIKFMV